MKLLASFGISVCEIAANQSWRKLRKNIRRTRRRDRLATVEFVANSEEPGEPPDRIPQGMDLALFRAVDRADRDESNPMASGEKANEHFGFDFELRSFEGKRGPHLELNETEAALGIGQRMPAEIRKTAAHPAIHESADKRHCFAGVHPITDNERSAFRVGGVKELRDIGRIVLAIAIEAERPGKAVRKSARQSGFQSESF